MSDIKPGSYVTREAGTQLARYIRAEHRYGVSGHRIMPLNNGTGDGYGLAEWVQHVIPVSIEVWGPVTGAPGMQVRWHYDPVRNAYRREYRQA